jgi:hypothetical protein
MGVLRNELLISFVLFPGNVTGMMVNNQDCPSLLGLDMSYTFFRSAINHAYTAFCSTKCIGASVGGILQHTIDILIMWTLPIDYFTVTIPCSGKQHVLIMKPPKDLIGTPKLSILLEHQCDGFLYTSVGVHLDFPLSCPDQTDR